MLLQTLLAITANLMSGNWRETTPLLSSVVSQVIRNSTGSLGIRKLSSKIKDNGFYFSSRDSKLLENLQGILFSWHNKATIYKIQLFQVKSELDVLLTYLFLTWLCLFICCSQQPECRTGSKESTESAVDLLGLGKTWPTLYQRIT